MPTLHLNRNLHRCLDGHCWVFSSEIARLDGRPADGDLVDVIDPHGLRVGTGYYNQASRIVVRLLTRTAETINDAWWDRRLTAAIAHRERVLPATWTARRLVSSEGDLLPGLIVDRFADHLVVQFTTLGMDVRRDTVFAALDRVAPSAVVVERSDLPIRRHEGLQPRSGVVRGDLGPLVQRVGEATCRLDLLDPHKTGTYLDQQANQLAIRRWVTPGARVLDVFCHLAGFGIHAALAGAGEVIAVDSAAASCAGARESARLSGVEGRLRVIEANAFDDLRARDDAGERFDLVVLDPPSFARNRDALEGALRGYKELHLRALRLLKPGGILATFSCSHHIDGPGYEANVLEAAHDARVILRREAVLGASADHPILPAVPESEYLKGFVYQVLDRW